MIEQKVKIVILATDLEAVLASDQSKTDTHLEQEVAQVREQGTFELTLPQILAEI